MRARWVGRGLLVAAAVVTFVVGPSLAPAAHADDDPSWADVQAAKHSAAAKAAEVTVIEAHLSALQTKAAQLGTVAVQKAAVANAATAALARATQTADALASRTKAATADAEKAGRTAAAIATQLYQSGSPTVQVWLSGEHSDELLDKLGSLGRLTTTSSALLDRAVAESREAQALGAQAKAAAAERHRLQVAAAKAADAAKAAEQQAEAQVAQTKTEEATLQAQLASLQSNYSALKASYAAAQAAKAAAAAAGDGGGGSSLSGLSPGPGSLSPAGAQDYASSVLGNYGWGGGQMSCLVQLWNIESGWEWNAYNASSGAYGIPQSLPGSKMSSAGGDWTTSSRTQIDWGLGYIQSRYGSPCAALSFETSHTPYWY